MSIPEMYTEGIDTVGIVRRVFFHFRHEEGGISNWHYFGTSPVDKPPTTDDPVFEHIYIQFPNDLDALPEMESEMALYSLALMACLVKEGIE